AGVTQVLAMLERTGVRATVETSVAAYHDEARAALHNAAEPGANPYRDALLRLIEKLAVRVG
ncbi:MAG: hypothetical protein H0U10_14140, partial [Chloroflexia bacterium]|nr:hypothetical protein [Chloroflexia bacterium]